MHSANYIYCLPFRNISPGTKVELELNPTKKSNISSYFLCRKAKGQQNVFFDVIFPSLPQQKAKAQPSITNELVMLPTS